jgi:anti-anti-sigma factor
MRVHMKAQAGQRTPAPEIVFEVPQAGTAIVKLRGELDISSRSCLAQALAGATEQAKVLVDLSECTFADSSVVVALVSASAELRERGGRLEVVIPPAANAVYRLAQLARLSDIVRVHESRSAACASLHPRVGAF